eukprot:208252-Rhodomonas_salina.1
MLTSSYDSATPLVLARCFTGTTEAWYSGTTPLVDDEDGEAAEASRERSRAAQIEALQALTPEEAVPDPGP